MSETSTATQTQEFFHSYAGDFNAIYSSRNGVFNNLINRTLRKSMQLRYIKTLEGATPVVARTVLDVGCGPGHYGIALARRGAARVTGIDFAEGMIELARQQAKVAGVSDCCEFLAGDFTQYRPEAPFDYVVVMGFMDYVSEPAALIDRVNSLTRRKAFFSFPAAGGILAWQRQVRYRRRCPLYLYHREDLEKLFANVKDVRVEIEPIARDYFVTMTKR
ncbi:MAG TPA: methyltransferase domain-containing protein [Bryobacteraceae bacterium]|nr:methyltransferase domain-containing protein [Bryobacteraceae bacterium]